MSLLSEFAGDTEPHAAADSKSACLWLCLHPTHPRELHIKVSNPPDYFPVVPANTGVVKLSLS